MNWSEACPTLRWKWIRVILVGLALAFLANVVFAALTLNGNARQALSGISPEFLVLGICLALVPWLTMALRTWIWGRFLGENMTFADAFHITLAGDLGNAVTPTLAGGNTVKFVLFLRGGVSPGRASALLALFTVEDALFFAVSLPVAYWISSGIAGPTVRSALNEAGERAAIVLGAALLVGLLAAWIWRARRGSTPSSEVRFGVSGPGRLAGWWREARSALGEVLRRGKLRATATLGLTAIQWICRYSVVAAILAAFGIEVFPPVHLLLQWVVFTAGTVIPTPGGSAAVEAAFAVVYHPFVPDALLGPVTALWRFVLFYLLLGLNVAILAACFLRRRSYGIRSRWNRNPTSIMPEKKVSSAPATWFRSRTTLAPKSQASQSSVRG